MVLQAAGLPKKGTFLQNTGPYPNAIARALQNQLGAAHQAVKIVMRRTGAGEQTVKNWLAGITGPIGQHRVDLIRHSDDVLEMLLLLAERQRITSAMKLVDGRVKPCPVRLPTPVRLSTIVLPVHRRRRRPLSSGVGRSPARSREGTSMPRLLRRASTSDGGVPDLASLRSTSACW